MSIRILPPLLVNQIAAGEVVERPASVVKELVENAVDAGATAIDIEIEEGGRELIRVTDDGSGIAADELVLALTAHATSKIARSEDLEGIATMGFRGEALASIASVSRVTLSSRPRGAEAGATLDAEGDQSGTPRPAGMGPGTRVVVRNLFFNTPARRRFLRSPQAEGTRVAETVRALALAHPGIGFRFLVDGRERLSVTASASLRERVRAVLGQDTDAGLLDVEAADGDLRLRGMVGTPDLARATARALHVVLNGRPIVDRVLQHALREGYRGLIEPAQWPLAVVWLEMDPRQVDVNVHPAKSEVRFHDPQRVHALVRRGVRSALGAEDLVPRLDLTRSTAPAGGGRMPTGAPYRPAPPMPASRTGGRGPGAGPAPTPRERATGPSGFDYQAARHAMRAAAPSDLAFTTGASAGPDPGRDVAGGAWAAPTAAPSAAIQVHRMFIVAEDAEGLLVIDQHALHERVMFEQLRARILAGTLESQPFLVPEAIEAGAGEMEALESLQPLLRRIGIEAAPVGPRSVAVSAFPSLLVERGVSAAPFMQSLLARAAEAPIGDSEEALFEVLDMMACKAAVKAGDRLTPAEISSLLAQRESVERSSRCPHGRPTTLRLTIRDLERQFGRR